LKYKLADVSAKKLSTPETPASQRKREQRPFREESDAGAYLRGYKWIYTPNIAMHCTSKGQDSRCDQFPAG